MNFQFSVASSMKSMAKAGQSTVLLRAQILTSIAAFLPGLAGILSHVPHANLGSRGPPQSRATSTGACVGHVPWFCPGWTVPHPCPAVNSSPKQPHSTTCVPWSWGCWVQVQPGAPVPADVHSIPRGKSLGECSSRVNCHLFLLHFTSLQQAQCCFLNKGLNQ